MQVSEVDAVAIATIDQNRCELKINAKSKHNQNYNTKKKSKPQMKKSKQQMYTLTLLAKNGQRRCGLCSSMAEMNGDEGELQGD